MPEKWPKKSSKKTHTKTQKKLKKNSKQKSKKMQKTRGFFKFPEIQAWIFGWHLSGPVFAFFLSFALSFF